MIQPSELLRTYALLLQRLTGARRVAVYLPAPQAGNAPPVLFTTGDGPAVDELADLDAAEAFLQRWQVDRCPGATELLARLAGARDGVWLLRLPSPDALPELLERAGAASAAGAGPGGYGSRVWLGLSLPPGVALPWPESAERLADPAAWWSWLFGLGGALGWHTQELAEVLQDPVSQLPARAGFQVQLDRLLNEARADRRQLSLVLVNPEDFELVNERFGREIGDQVIREVGERLRTTLRRSDLLGRYGGAVFAAALVGTAIEDCGARIEHLRRELSLSPYRNSSVRLGFVFGAAGTSVADDAPPSSAVDLLQRAEIALSAARKEGGGQTVFASDGQASGPHLDRLSGIFTANLSKDYRNMLLLWDTVTIVAGSSSFAHLAARIVDRLFATFKPQRVGLFGAEDDGRFELLCGRERRQFGSLETELELDPAGVAVLREAQASGKPAQIRLPAATGEEPRILHALPLMAIETFLGCLYLEGTPEWLDLDSSDLIFLRALSSHLAVAFDRARLAEQEQRRQERERQTLRAELQELRHALQQAKLVYRSSQMEDLLGTVQRVAPTDATVLITGESGTGKELVARTLHELSLRRQAPLVVVDCTAIADSLIDSELFGHEKGAFTGAQSRGIGRLEAADGGTVVLDEIGEMPLRVQSKLLRFVQEKQLTPVGSTRSRRVDARVVAVTNRDLGREAAEGSFRQDLYYRLNVVRLVVPPLRERPDDILHLADYFLKRFSIQYQKGLLRFSAEAEQLLLRYPWPGNVRELENRLRQAVILGASERLGTADLGIETGGTVVAAAPARPGSEVEGPAPAIAPPVARSEPAPAGPATTSIPAPATPVIRPLASGRPAVDVWTALGNELERQLSAALASPTPRPLGRWLAEDLVLEAHRASGQVQSQGARLLGIAETTFRRRFLKIDVNGSGLPSRAEPWQRVHLLLAELLAACAGEHEDLPETARRLLLTAVASQLPAQTKRGAALMGVSEPTYRNWLQELPGAPQTS